MSKTTLRKNFITIVRDCLAASNCGDNEHFGQKYEMCNKGYIVHTVLGSEVYTTQIAMFRST